MSRRATKEEGQGKAKPTILAQRRKKPSSASSSSAASPVQVKRRASRRPFNSPAPKAEGSHHKAMVTRNSTKSQNDAASSLITSVTRKPAGTKTGSINKKVGSKRAISNKSRQTGNTTGGRKSSGIEQPAEKLAKLAPKGSTERKEELPPIKYTYNIQDFLPPGDEGDEEDQFDPLLFIKSLPKLTEKICNRRSPLSAKSAGRPKISLALDLDETLVHCSVQPLEKAELKFKVDFNGVDYEVYVRTRPYLQQFLAQVSEWFEVIVFTASQKVYADKLLDILDPTGNYIEHRLFRDSCVSVDGNYLKDLHILGRDMKTVAIVDNSIQAFGFQLDNGIPIVSWFDDDHDEELPKLLSFLRHLKEEADVRPLISRSFQLKDFIGQLPQPSFSSSFGPAP